MGEGNEMKPSIGRIVHYMYQEDCRAAIVTQVKDATDSIELYVFPSAEGGPAGNMLSEYDPTGAIDTDGKDGTWHWPEREDLIAEHQKIEDRRDE
jgi:hypothetical protein